MAEAAGKGKKQKRTTKAGNLPIAVYVGHKLPTWITKEVLIQHFCAYEKNLVKEKCVICDPPGKRFGKLFFNDSKAADSAVSELNLSKLKDFCIHVNRWKDNTKEKGNTPLPDKEKKGAPRKTSTPEQVKNPKKEDSSPQDAVEFLKSLTSSNPQNDSDSDDDNNDDLSISDISSITTESSSVSTQPIVTAYVGHDLPENITEASLKKHFGSVGDGIRKVNFIQTKKSTRIARIRFASEEALQQAISEYDKTKLQGQLIRVSVWGTQPSKKTEKTKAEKTSTKTKPQQKGKTKKSSKSAQSDADEEKKVTQSPAKQRSRSRSKSRVPCSTTVTLTGLSQAVDEKLLKTICSQYGTIAQPIIVDHQHHRASVQFESPQEAEKAFTELNGLNLGGEQISALYNEATRTGSAGKHNKSAIGPSISEVPPQVPHPPTPGRHPSVPPGPQSPPFGPHPLAAGPHPLAPGQQPPSFGPHPLAAGPHPLAPGQQPPSFGPHPLAPGPQSPPFGPHPLAAGPHLPAPGQQPPSFGPHPLAPGPHPLAPGPHLPVPGQQPPSFGPHPLAPRPHPSGLQAPFLPYGPHPGSFPGPQSPHGPHPIRSDPPSPQDKLPKDSKLAESKEMTEALYDFFTKRFKREIADAASKGVSVCYKDGVITVEGPLKPRSEFLLDCVEPLADGSIPLSANQWNQLITAKDGVTLFQTISRPYQHNPNLQIDKKEDPFTLAIVGFKDAVSTARESFLCKLDRKMAVGSMELFALTKLKPDLVDAISAECNVRVSGFYSGSSELSLEGEEGNFPRARTKILGELDSVFVHRKKIDITRESLFAIQHYIDVNNFKVVLSSTGARKAPQPALEVLERKQHGETVKLTVCGTKKEDMNRTMNLLSKGPSKVTIGGISASQYQSLCCHAGLGSEKLLTEYGVFLQYAPENQSVVLHGFVKEDMSSVQGQMQAFVSHTAQTECPLQCSKEEEIFVSQIFFRKRTSQAVQLLEEISTDYNTTLKKTKKGLMLIGPEDKLESAAKFLRDHLLRHFQVKVFVLMSSPVLINDIKAQIDPLEEDGLVVVRMTSEIIEGEKQRRVSLTVLSCNVDAFAAACEKIQDIKPTTRIIKIPRGEKAEITPEFIKDTEERLLVHIHCTKKDECVMLIHGMDAEKVDQACSTIKKHSSEEVVWELMMTFPQAVFLKERCSADIARMKARVNFPPEVIRTPRMSSDRHATLKIQGIWKHVRSSFQEVNCLLEGFRGVSFDCERVDFCHRQEWENAAKNAIEADCNVVVFMPNLSSRVDSLVGDSMMENTAVMVYGTDDKELMKATNVFEDCTSPHVSLVKMSQSDKALLKRVLEEKRLETKGTFTRITFEDPNGIKLCAPKRFEGDMQALRDRIEDFLFQETHCAQDVPVEPLILKIILARHLDKIRASANDCKISSRAGDSDLLTISGKRDDVEDIISKIRAIEVDLKVRLCTQPIEVEGSLQSALDSPRIRIQIAKLEREHCVTIHLPDKPKTVNKVRSETIVPPTLPGPPGVLRLQENNLGQGIVKSVFSIVGNALFGARSSAIQQVLQGVGKEQLGDHSTVTRRWFWEADDGCYHPYTEKDSLKMDRIKTGLDVNQLHVGRKVYRFDFVNGFQINMSTGHRRRIKQSEIAQQPEATPPTGESEEISPIYILVNGCTEDVHIVEQKILGILRNPSDPEFAKEVASCERPPDWELDGSPLILRVVHNTSEEFRKVLHQMRESIPGVKIVTLQRIQNEWLWTKFSQHREMIREKNQGNLSEKNLFHGTRNTDPSLIYEGEEGFDMRYCERGMWGRGNYFAASAIYSHAYSHPTRGGMSQMFLARVVVGETFSCQPDSSLNMPPMKSSSSSSMFKNERYDSVSGITKGSQVYIIYDNQKAYPLYLVTYRVH